jgi:hypothetical protein
MRNAYDVLLGKSERKNHWVDLGVDGKVIFEWILGKSFGKTWTGCVWLRLGGSSGVL